MDLDEILLKVGEFGRYQKLLLWFVCLPACIPCGFCAFNQIFMSGIPNHWCRVGALLNFTREQQRNVSIPYVNNHFDNCQRYVVNWTDLLLTSDGLLNNVLINESWPTEDCVEGWVYDTTTVSSSIVIDFDLVCQKSMYPTFGLVGLNAGGPIGVYIFGKLNDSIGRKLSFFLCLTVLLLGSILTIASPNFWCWLGSRVIVGLTIPAIYQIPFIISLELVGPNYRSFVTVMTCLFYTFGLMMLSGVTYLVQNWMLLGIVTSMPFTLYYVYWFFLPESPRWLLATGRYDEAFEIIQKLAKLNKKELPNDIIRQFEEKVVRSSEEIYVTTNHSCFDLCRTTNIRLKTFLITLNWFANETVYVGLSYYSPSLGSSEYLSFLLSSVVEIPSYLFCCIIMDKWGRRWPICICMFVCGVCCITTAFLPTGYVNTTFILFLISKSAVSASFLIIYPFAGELYPTQLRGLGIGLSAYVGGLGLIIIPFITFLGSEMLTLPLIIMGFIAVIGAISVLRLPETLHYRLPKTIEEGEEFGKKFSMADCIRCVPLTTDEISCSEGNISKSSSIEQVEEIPLQHASRRKLSLNKLVKQHSFMNTQKSSSGAMQVTYWF